MVERLIWVDYLILGIIGLSALVGIWRGMLREALSLVSWCMAFLLAVLFADQAVVRLTPYIDVPSVRAVLAFGGVFLAALFSGGLLNILIAVLVRRTPLGLLDRFIATLFGGVRGVAVVVVLVLLAGLTPAPTDPWWQQSVLLPHFQASALWLRALMPAEFAQYLVFSDPAEV